ncbi:MAG: ATP-dependent Clp protease adaptor ClpS, partial [Planctomycetes bacterium]|nr:ATP-dependent Clp protease adaptor ClpS [Planctomycetota bacterium]
MRPGISVTPERDQETETRLTPLYHVILLDDQLHTYEYVIEMITKVFRKSAEKAFRHAVEVDATGVTILETCPLEVAELRRDQVKGYGGDWRLGSSISMQSVIERA